MATNLGLLSILGQGITNVGATSLAARNPQQTLRWNPWGWKDAFYTDPRLWAAVGGLAMPAMGWGPAWAQKTAEVIGMGAGHSMLATETMRYWATRGPAGAQNQIPAPQSQAQLPPPAASTPAGGGLSSMFQRPVAAFQQWRQGSYS